MKLKEKSSMREFESRNVLKQSGIPSHDISPIEKAEGQRFKSFPRNYMDVVHKIKMRGSKASNVKDAGASNGIIKRNVNQILIYLENFNYRKNIDYKKVVMDLNNYFLIEFICALSRVNIHTHFVFCLEDYNNCPINNIWEKMKLYIK